MHSDSFYMQGTTMNEWIAVKDKKPDNDIFALVANEKGWMRNIKALYFSKDDVWSLYDPNYHETLLLEVSHYIEIPEFELIYD